MGRLRIFNPLLRAHTVGKIKDPSLAGAGRLSYGWARQHMQILDRTISRLRDSQPLDGVTVACCLHITKETSVLLMGLKELGATVACCPGNPLTTQDEVAAFLDSEGINVYAWNDQSPQEYDWCIDQPLHPGRRRRRHERKGPL